jgi:hypothetical protein
MARALRQPVPALRPPAPARAPPASACPRRSFDRSAQQIGHAAPAFTAHRAASVETEPRLCSIGLVLDKERKGALVFLSALAISFII